MPSNTYNPSIDQAALQNFQDSFYELAQQTKSRLVAAGVAKFLPSKGKTNNMARIGRLDLSKVATRNPDKAYGDYALDNRQFTKERYTKTITIDAKFDINELIKDPTSDIMKQLVQGKERVIDRVIVQAAVGPVLVGAPDVATTSITAAQDGVLTVDATGGFTYAKVTEISQNFFNNDIGPEEVRGTVLAITGKENSALMAEDKFINTFYISGKPVEEGFQKQVGMFRVVIFAGSVNGGAQITSPILPELTTTRQCVVLAPESIALAMELGDLSVERNPLKVNSWDITIDFWMNAMRTEGARVQIVTTTM